MCVAAAGRFLLNDSSVAALCELAFIRPTSNASEATTTESVFHLCSSVAATTTESVFHLCSSVAKLRTS